MTLIEFDLLVIGSVGPNAKKKLQGYSFVRLCGRLSGDEQSIVLNSCHIAIYPRTFDHKRKILKISEFAGANLPIVAYEMEDTRDIETFGFGLCVKNPREFTEAIRKLYENREFYKEKKMNAKRFSKNKDWESLSLQIENVFQS
jgi:glycosyltransferase involved in cell wall biosynthesis